MSPAQYNPQNEGLENNAHCLASCYDFLSVTLGAIFARNDQPLAYNWQKEFVNFSSTVFMYLRSLPEARDQNPKEVEALYGVLRRLVRESSLLTDDCFGVSSPYTNLQITVREGFRRRFQADQPTANVLGRRADKNAAQLDILGRHLANDPFSGLDVM